MIESLCLQHLFALTSIIHNTAKLGLKDTSLHPELTTLAMMDTTDMV